MVLSSNVSNVCNQSPCMCARVGWWDHVYNTDIYLCISSNVCNASWMMGPCIQHTSWMMGPCIQHTCLPTYATSLPACVYIYLYTCVYIHVYICVCVYIHIYKYIYLYATYLGKYTVYIYINMHVWSHHPIHTPRKKRYLPTYTTRHPVCIYTYIYMGYIFRCILVVYLF